MNKILLLLCFVFCQFSASAQYRTTPIITKVTATWCPNCGTWGWSFFEDLKTIYGNGDEALLLGVHHSGDLKNPTSQWFANNLGFTYQPQFYLDRTPLNVSSGNRQAKVSETQMMVNDLRDNSSDIEVSFVNAYFEGDDIITNLTINKSTPTNNNLYLAVYVFENNVENNQSQQGMAMHPNVLRDVLSNEYFGEMIASNGSQINNLQINLSKTLNTDWNKDNIGLVAVVQSQNGNNYDQVSSNAILNVGMLSSDDEVLEEDLVNILYHNDQLTIEFNNDDTYQVNLIGLAGQIIHRSTAQNRFDLNTSQYPTGLYAVQILTQNKILTKQVFID